MAFPLPSSPQVPPTPTPSGDQPPVAGAPALGTSSAQKTDQELLTYFERWKKESFDQRWVFERQWMRNIWYLLNRQWIYFDGKKGQWQDKRLAKWIPRPVTNILKEGLQSVRANFAAINYGASARPVKNDNLSVVTANVADSYAPLIHEDHRMDTVMNEADFWLLGCGNSFLHTAINYERKNGITTVRYETCPSCAWTGSELDINESQQLCPQCGKPGPFLPAMDPATGAPKIDQVPLPKGITYALSPFEIAFPLIHDQWEDVPVVIRIRWRTKDYYEQNEAMVAGGYHKSLQFVKTPQERTMQIFKSLPFQSDLGIAPPYFASGGANTDSEGIVEYDVWVKPCADFPDGYVFRVAGDTKPTIIHSEAESLPGPLPYHNSDGSPRFTFHHARYEHVGGRILGSGMLDNAIGKQDTVNQLDSHIMMVIGRMANPIWLEPKGAEVEKFTGEPGLVVKWNPLLAGGNAKPERIPGEGVNMSVFQYRAMQKQEAEELMGTFDIMKGEKPAGTEAYAAMSFLYERATGRHASAYKSRASQYKGWMQDALAIEQEFGEDMRTTSKKADNGTWSFDTFKRADLKGTVDIIIEDGTTTAKTALMERAAIDHLAQLGLLDPADPDQKTAIFQKFGQETLMPSIDAQVQEAWMNMDKLEKFLGDPQAIAMAQQQHTVATMQSAASGEPPPVAGPLQWKRWYNPAIHRNELIKWCLSDKGRSVMKQYPPAEGLIDAYLTQIDMALAMQQMGIVDMGGGQMINTKPPQQPPGQPGQPGAGGPPQQQGKYGRAQQMGNSNQNAAGVGQSSAGAGGTTQQQPAV